MDFSKIMTRPPESPWHRSGQPLPLAPLIFILWLKDYVSKRVRVARRPKENIQQTNSTSSADHWVCNVALTIRIPAASVRYHSKVCFLKCRTIIAMFLECETIIWSTRVLWVLSIKRLQMKCHLCHSCKTSIPVVISCISHFTFSCINCCVCLSFRIKIS